MEHDPVAVDAEASRLVAALESAWRSIQRAHPGVPDAVIVLGTGVERGRLSKLGHWWGGQWVADGTPRGEVLLAGEALHLKPTDVFEVLLHEATHGLNTARGVKDVSRGGRYHNARFKATAIELGLQVGALPPHGWAKTQLAPATAERYPVEIDRIGEEMRIARRINRGAAVDGTPGGDGRGPGADTTEAGEVDGTKKQKPAECGCGRKMRMAPSVLAKGPVVCGVCNTSFEIDRVAAANLEPSPPPGGVRGDDADRSSVVDSFVERRERQLGTTPVEPPNPRHPSARLAASVDHAEIVGQLRSRLRSAEDASRLVAVAAWRGLPGAEPDAPMVAADWSEHARLTQLARTVMTIDGTLTVPDGMPTGSPLLVGERVKTASRVDRRFEGVLPEPGTPGRVVAIDPAERRVTVDFATWGRTEIPLDDAHQVLRWDYATIDTPTGSVTTATGAEPPSPTAAATAETGVDIEL